ncbi:DUF2057 domain-containing protein [Shewanella profunda]|uniref:YccT family protein n=1 Tax=Shewanella profunda TaxID=254793 RepID=UPI00200EFB26|nr:DUF2057 domain-containing protein [Shewanella profunda]MCL1090480.1 DUF2057 domain-containing protein [Shewanella profunda]
MKYHSILCTTALILGIVQPAMADVNLKIPQNVELLTVNGKQSLNRDDLILADGINQIAFRYTAQYRQQANTVRYQSDVLIIRFDESDQTLILKLPPITSARDAKQFDTSPTVTLMNTRNEAVNVAQDKLIKNGLQIGRDFEHEMLQYNLGDRSASLKIAMISQAAAPQAQSSAVINPSLTHQAPVVASTSLVAPAVIAPSETSANNQNQPNPQDTLADTPSQTEISQMLDYWYKLANDDTKASFKAKINQQ